MRGKVKTYRKHGFGFIESYINEEVNSVFFHRSDIIGKTNLIPGCSVEFELGEREGKPCAKKVVCVSWPKAVSIKEIENYFLEHEHEIEPVPPPVLPAPIR